MYNQVVVAYWYPITSQLLPFPTSRAISALPPGDGALSGSGNVAYQDPSFAGIYIKSNGASGAAERWVISNAAAQVGKRFKVYVNFGNLWYVFELQTWGAGSWVMENPGGQPRIPNQIIFGVITPMYDDFPPNEADPAHPPPTHNPFQPRLILAGIQDGDGNYLEEATATLIQVTNVTIDNVFVYKNGVLIPVTMTDLLSGHVFKGAGDYEIVIHYHYSNYPIEILTQPFTIVVEPYPLLQLERLEGGVISPGDFLIFDNPILHNGGIGYNPFTGLIEFRQTGVYFLQWFIAPETGLTTDGVNFALKTNTPAKHPMQNIHSSGHILVSALCGFAIVDVTELPVVAKLVNTSDSGVTLSAVAHVKAGIAAFKI